MPRRALRILCLVASLVLPPITAPADAAGTPAAGFHLLQEIALPGEGGWDYLAVDAAARRLYVTHATRVVVVDVDSGKILGEIPDLQGVHGVAWASDISRGFIVPLACFGIVALYGYLWPRLSQAESMTAVNLNAGH